MYDTGYSMNTSVPFPCILARKSLMARAYGMREDGIEGCECVSKG